MHPNVDNSELDVGHSGQRPPPPPFSIQEFGDLISSALDLHRVPESALEFSFRSQQYFSPSNSNHHGNSLLRCTLPLFKSVNYSNAGTFPRRQLQGGPHPSNTPNMFRGTAFLRKSASQSASLSAVPTPPEIQSHIAFRTDEPTRLRASTSVPSLLNKVGAHTRSEKRVDAFNSSAALLGSDAGGSDDDSDVSPHATAFPLTPATPPVQGNFRFPWARSRKGAKQPVCSVHAPVEISSARLSTRTRTKSSPMSFLNLKPLPVVPVNIPILPKIPSRPTLISSTQSLLQSDPIQPPASETTGSHEGSGSEALRSFFDDSGYEDDLEVLAQIVKVDALRKTKSRPALRSFFSPSASANGAVIPKRPSNNSIHGREGHERTWSDKLLTPLATRWYRSDVTRQGSCLLNSFLRSWPKPHRLQ